MGRTSRRTLEQQDFRSLYQAQGPASAATAIVPTDLREEGDDSSEDDDGEVFFNAEADDDDSQHSYVDDDKENRTDDELEADIRKNMVGVFVFAALTKFVTKALPKLGMKIVKWICKKLKDGEEDDAPVQQQQQGNSNTAQSTVVP